MGLYDRDYMRQERGSDRLGNCSGRKNSRRKTAVIIAAVIMILLFLTALLL